jgi:hypothetical protein
MRLSNAPRHLSPAPHSVATVGSPKTGFRHLLVDVHQLDICLEPKLAGPNRAFYKAQHKAAIKNMERKVNVLLEGGSCEALVRSPLPITAN